MIKNVIIFSALICGALLLEFDHPCREDVDAKTNFLPAAYTGIWYEIQRSDDDGADCLIHHYTRRALLDLFDVVRDGVFEQTHHRETGEAWVAFPEETPMRAIFNATVNRVTGQPINYQYRIHASDYSNYAIMWMCTDLPGGRSVEEGAVLGRTTVLSPAINNIVTFLLSEIGFDRANFRYIDHDMATCFF